MEKDTLNRSLEDSQLYQIGRALKQLRIDKGISNYEALADALDMARSQYGPYENGKNLRLGTLLRILNYHQISLTDFCNKYLNAPNE
ncbi:MAG: helix-turn-helix domain-containing protein [Fluviicola sp.]